ncbi:MAG: VanZ family protein, partial [Gammaproteobacteria bacterium]
MLRRNRTPIGLARSAFGLTVALIIYGSLYPFDFSPVGCDDWDFLFKSESRPSSLVDILGNIALFLPFGFFATLASGNQRTLATRSIAAIVFAALLATLLQVLQVWLPSRVPSVRDIASNLVGATTGTALATLVTMVGNAETMVPWRRAFRTPLAATLFGLYLAAQFAPFVPTLAIGQLHDALANLLIAPRWNILDTAWYGAQLLGAGMLLAALVPMRWVLPGLSILALFVFVGHIILIGRSADISLVAGLVGACLLWSEIAHYSVRQRRGIVATVLFLAYSASALTPLRFDTVIKDFNLVPFADLLDGRLLVNLQAFLPRLYVFSILLWLAAPAVRAAALVLASWVLLLELAQTTIIGRTPSLTDPLTVVLAGILLARLMHGAATDESLNELRYPMASTLAVPTGRSPDLLRTLIALITCITGIAVGLWILVRLPGVPYNLRELLHDSGSMVAAMATAMSALWFGAGGALLGRQLATGGKPWLIFPLGTLGAATFALLLMRLGVTTESIADVAGSNNLYWFVTQKEVWGTRWRDVFLALPNPTWVSVLERPVRFTALVAPLFIALAISYASLEGNRARWSQAVRLLTWALPYLWLCKAIAFDWSSTDNLNELIARDGPWGLGGGGYLYGVLVLAAVSA